MLYEKGKCLSALSGGDSHVTCTLRQNGRTLIMVGKSGGCISSGLSTMNSPSSYECDDYEFSHNHSGSGTSTEGRSIGHLCMDAFVNVHNVGMSYVASMTDITLSEGYLDGLKKHGDAVLVVALSCPISTRHEGV